MESPKIDIGLISESRNPYQAMARYWGIETLQNLRDRENNDLTLIMSGVFGNISRLNHQTRSTEEVTRFSLALEEIVQTSKINRINYSTYPDKTLEKAIELAGVSLKILSVLRSGLSTWIETDKVIVKPSSSSKTQQIWPLNILEDL